MRHYDAFGTICCSIAFDVLLLVKTHFVQNPKFLLIFAHVRRSDRAKRFANPAKCRELWVAAHKQYEAAIHLDASVVQAHNNCGLALRHIAALTPLNEREPITTEAISRFRKAIHLPPGGFDRAIYNLGTVLHKRASEVPIPLHFACSTHHPPPPASRPISFERSVLPRAHPPRYPTRTALDSHV
eukprot:5258475-Pyramimonas_sp.AAC.1